MSGHFIVSLDFELLWGVRDHADRDTYGKNVLGVRDAVPKMLELFAENEISATWATVGFLFCESKEELMASLPSELPVYSNPRRSACAEAGAGAAGGSSGASVAPSLISVTLISVSCTLSSGWFSVAISASCLGFRMDVSGVRTGESIGALASIF